MSEVVVHEVKCPHFDCDAIFRIKEFVSAGKYDCKCKAKRLRLSWSTSMTFERKPYLALVEKEEL